MKKREVEVVDFNTPYREQCYVNIVMEEEIGECCERQCVIGSLARIMRGRNISMEVKRRLRNSIVLKTLT